MKQLVFLGLVIISVFTNTHLMAQDKAVSKLSASDQSLISISALTGRGDLEKLKVALNRGLEHGLTVNEIKEVLIHTYAYCGFPRSIRGLQTFMGVLSERQGKGIKDEMGNEASDVVDIESNKYDRGKKILGELTQTVPADTLSGYSAFAPTIDRFLKEHLFADIFERDVLTYAQRELVTVSVLAAIGQAEPMLNSHLTICLNVGLSPEQLQQYVDVLRLTIGETDAEAAQKVLDKVIEKRK